MHRLNVRKYARYILNVKFVVVSVVNVKKLQFIETKNGNIHIQKQHKA